MMAYGQQAINTDATAASLTGATMVADTNTTTYKKKEGEEIKIPSLKFGR